jgi:acyl-CoA synthetase (NDP forming)
VADQEQAVAAAERLGYPVVLKTLAERFRHRLDLGGVRLDVSEPELRGAFTTMVEQCGGPGQASLVVQAMAPPGVSVAIGVVDDPSFGPVMSFGVAGAAMELLGDRAYRILPAGDAEVAELVRSVKAAPLLFGDRGAELVDVAALEELLLRVGCLAEDLPEVAEVRLAPVTVGAQGLAVLHAEVSLAPPPARTPWGPRALTPAL